MTSIDSIFFLHTMEVNGLEEFPFLSELSL